MKHILITAVFVGALGSFAAAKAAERTVTFAVENMTCVSCPYIVKKTMERVEGVSKVDVSYSNQTATVTFDDTRISPDAVSKASTEAGYPATSSEQGG